MKAASDINFISHCGLYCGACPKYIEGQCKGCKGAQSKYLKHCKVYPCTIENDYHSCAECTIIDNVKNCKKFNRWNIRLGEFLTGTSRAKGIKMIKEQGKNAFIEFMILNQFVSVKKVKKVKLD